MAQKKSLNTISVGSLIQELKSSSTTRFFTNDDVLIALNGNPASVPFLKQGEIYQLEEPRMILVLEGSANVRINLEDHHVEKGTILFTMHDVIFEVKHVSDDINVVGIVFREGINIAQDVFLKNDPAEFNRLLRLIYLTWDIVHLSPYRKDTIVHLLQAMVSNVRYMEDGSEQSSPASKKTRTNEQFRQFKRLVSKHCVHERSIPFYAEQLRITPHHLSSVIKRASGKSVMYWVHRAVIQKAKMLLRTTNMMGYEVGKQLNFPSDSSFSKFFKRETGMTPKQYKEGGV